MSRIFAFNGDADGLCALQQLRLSEPGPSTLVTGVKRDIELLARVDARSGDLVTALDISLDSNREGLNLLLERGASVRYFDHHHAGEIPSSPLLQAHIDMSTEVCTSVLVDNYLHGTYRAWAATAAFGDSLPQVGQALVQELNLSPVQGATLARLGIALNYNAYGESLSDLHFDPAVLAEQMLPYASPFDFVAQSKAFMRLWGGYQADMETARALKPERQSPGITLLKLPDEPWARRAIGVLANELMHANPGNAIGILSPRSTGGYTVSVRVPKASSVGADEFCREFPTGGGRRGAAGINLLPDSDIKSFVERFEARFAQR